MKLIYRAETYLFQPAPVIQPKSWPTKTFELLYRGNAYRYGKVLSCPTPVPTAINWRFVAPIPAKLFTPVPA
jgi:hypothetical protein